MVIVKYERRPSYVQVVRWKLEDWPSIKEWLKANDCGFIHDGSVLKIQNRKGYGSFSTLFIGDYLVRDSSKEFFGLKELELDTYYEECIT